MNNIIRACLLALLASASLSIAAAPSTELKVVGTLKPLACSLSLSNAGYVIYGLISSSSLSKTNVTVLPTRSATFSVACDAPTRIALTFSDNRQSSKVRGLFEYTGAVHTGWHMDRTMYGLGTASGANIGAFQLGIGNVQQDGAALYGAQSSYSGDGNWGRDTTGLVAHGRFYAWGSYGAASLKNITGELSVTPVLQKNISQLTGEQINLDGSVTVELHYL